RDTVRVLLVVHAWPKRPQSEFGARDRIGGAVFERHIQPKPAERRGGGMDGQRGVESRRRFVRDEADGVEAARGIGGDGMQARYNIIEMSCLMHRDRR